MPVRGPRPVYLVAALGVALLAAAVGAHALEGLGGPLAAGDAHYVSVTQADRSGLFAGLVSHDEIGLFGVSVAERPVSEGWIVAHPDDATVVEGARAEVLEDIPFEDPNGGTWLEQRVRIGEHTAWIVPVDVPRYDETLDGEYNFALVVDWQLVPEGSDLAMTHVSDLDLAGNGAVEPGADGHPSQAR